MDGLEWDRDWIVEGPSLGRSCRTVIGWVGSSFRLGASNGPQLPPTSDTSTYQGGAAPSFLPFDNAFLKDFSMPKRPH